jgi:hypothetical protein
MSKRNLQNEELDRIGRKLLDAAKMRGEEIERVVCPPALFNAVKARIETEKRELNSKSVFGGWANLQIWNPQTVAAAFLFLFFVGVFGLVGVSKYIRQQSAEQAAVPETQPKIKQFEISQPTGSTFGESPTIVKIKNPATESPKIIKLKVSVNKTLQTQNTAAQKPNRQKRFQPEQNESVGDFYALTFAGNPGESGQEVHIVRTELSRSSLFALGVNLPIENETPKIKTDLLVGADGIARAIRFVANSKNQ